MRLPVACLAAALLVAGCTGFPAGTRIVAELEVGDLGPGEGASRNFTLDAPAPFLLLGFRTGPAEHLHALLRAPNGTAYDTATAERLGACVVTGAAPGAWQLEVWADPFDGRLGGGKFTVRVADEAPATLYPCADAPFPAQGRTVSLGAWNLTLAPGDRANLTFEQPWPLANLTAAWRAPANATLPAVLVVPPAGEPRAPEAVPSPVPLGTWAVHVHLPPDAPPLDNATLSIRGEGM